MNIIYLEDISINILRNGWFLIQTDNNTKNYLYNPKIGRLGKLPGYQVDKDTLYTLIERDKQNTITDIFDHKSTAVQLRKQRRRSEPHKKW